MTEHSRLPTLDGLRAISILMVIVGHWMNAFAPGPSMIRATIGNGNLGVTVFFVISGYLITSLLMKDNSLGRFYFRRALRIFPAFYFFLIVVYSLGYASSTAVTVSGFYLWDYMRIPGEWAVAHTWSLSIEEKFYLFWPAMMLLGRRKAWLIASTGIILVPILRVMSAGNDNINFMFHTRIDVILIGCWFALRGEKLPAITRAQAIMAGIFVWIVSPLLAQWLGGAYVYTVGYTFEGVLIACVIVWGIKNPPAWLQTPVLVHIGLISYSLYLWQGLFLGSPRFSPWLAVPASFVCAELSYFIIEKPFLALRSWAPRRAIGSAASQSR